jgi:hypothetical protein
LWQLAQPLVMPVWFIFPPLKLVVELWHVSQVAVVAMWVDDLPNAVLPL